MKDLIKKILKEETSDLNPKVLSATYKMMDHLTKDCLWYYDTPEERFVYTPESIWLINPKTEQWVLQFDKSGRLWYYNEIGNIFKKYFNMKSSDFESFIKLWVEDALKRGVSTTPRYGLRRSPRVEDALKRGVSTTSSWNWTESPTVEDALKRGKKLR